MYHIRKIRNDRGWSITYVSGLTGISASDISQLERGRIFVHPSWRRRLATAFQMPAEELFRVVQNAPATQTVEA